MFPTRKAITAATVAFAPMKFRYVDRCHASQSAYFQPIYYIQIHQQKQDGMNETWIVYAGRNLLWLSGGLSFLSSRPGRARLMLKDVGNMLNSIP